MTVEMTRVTVEIDTGYVSELLGHIREDLRDAIWLMLIAVPEAARQLARGNAVTAFALLKQADNFHVKKQGFSNEMVLNMAFSDLPTEFRICDIDPD